MSKKQQTAKDYLSQAYRIDQRINSKIEQVSSLHDLATKATSTLSDIPPSGTRNFHSMENIICKILDLESDINTDLNNLLDLKREIVELIKSISNHEYQTIMELRYLCYKPWEQIAVNMDYSIHHLYKIHNAALEYFSDLMKHDT